MRDRLLQLVALFSLVFGLCLPGVAQAMDPVVATPTFTPAAPGASSGTLTCESLVTDADGIEDVSWRVFFYDETTASANLINSASGTVLATNAATGETASHTLDISSRGGDTIVCVVDADDGVVSSPVSDNASVTIDADTAEAVTTPVLTPSPAGESDTLTCSSTVSDADNETVAWTISWYNDSVATINLISTATGSMGEAADSESVSATLSLSGRGAEVVLCEIEADDSNSTTATANSSTLTVNSTPDVGTVSLSPPSPSEVDHTLTCSASVSDPDSDDVYWTLSWDNGSAISSVTGTELAAGSPVTVSDTLDITSRGSETITCQIDIRDRSNAGDTDSETDTSSNSVVVTSNTAPTVGTPSITGTTKVDEVLTCSATLQDQDGELIDWDVTWYRGTTGGTQVRTVSGTVAAGGPPSSGTASDTYTVVAADLGSIITCLVEAADQTAGTDSANAATSTISNTDPIISSPTVSDPTGGVVTNTDTLTCSASVFDPDNHQVDWVVSWHLNSTAGSTLNSAVGSFTSSATQTVSDTYTAQDSDFGSDIYCKIAVTDASGGTDSASDSISTESPPSIGTPAISGESLGSRAATGDTLTCSATITDGDSAIDWLVEWYTNSGFTGSPEASNSGTAASSGVVASDSISASSYAGQTLYCLVTATDADTGAEVTDGSASSVVNTAPSTPTVTITDPADTTDTITCTTTLSDGDSDSMTWTLDWTVDGASAGTASGAGTSVNETLAAGTAVYNEVVACSVTPSDGFETGTAGSDSVTLDNVAPAISSLAIVGTAAASNTLTCGADVYDPDGHQVTWNIAWWGGTSSTYTTTLTETGSPATAAGSFSSTSTQSISHTYKVTGSDVVSHARIWCVATASDGVASTVTDETSIAITNSPPTATVALSTTSPKVQDTLTCTYTYADADSETESGSVTKWYVNASLAATDVTASESSPSTRTPAALSAAEGDTVDCTVTPANSSGSGSETSSSVAATVANTAPTTTAPTVLAASPKETETITCGFTLADDDAADTTSATVQWYQGASFAAGTLLSSTSITASGATSATTTPRALGPVTIGNSIGCKVTPYDGTVVGTAQETSSVATVSNSDPTVVSPNITGIAETGQTLSCSAVMSDDDTGQSVGSTLTWLVGASSVQTATGSFTGGSATSTISDSYTVQASDVGQTITCQVVATDALSGTNTNTDTTSVASTPPTVTTPVLTTTGTAVVGSTLSCTADVDDIDSQTVNYTLEWYRGSSSGTLLRSAVSGSFTGGGSSTTVSDTYTVAAADAHDDVFCVVSAVDASSDTDQESTSQTIANTAPTISSAVVMSSTASPSVTGSTLTCTAAIDDPDQETVDWVITWRSGSTAGTSLDATSSSFSGPITGSAISATYVVDGSDIDTNVFCVLAVDDQNLGSGGGSDSDYIDNTDPVISGPTVSLSSGSAVVSGSVLDCTGSVSDVDEHLVNYTVYWRWDDPSTGTVQQSAASSFTGNGSADAYSDSYTVQSDDVAHTIYCAVEASDAMSGSASSSASVSVSNSAPTIDSVTVTPGSATTADTLTCELVFTDPDSQTLTPTITWHLDSTSGTTLSTATLSPSTYVGPVVSQTVSSTYAVQPDEVDHTIYCVASVDDTQTSSSGNDNQPINNTSPTVSVSTLTGTTFQTNDVVTCTAALAEIDAQSVDVTVEWLAGASSTGGGGTLRTSTTSSAYFSGSSTTSITSTYTVTPQDPVQDIFCVVTVDDADLTATDNASQTTVNTVPTVTTPGITGSASTGNALTCSADVFDEDDQTLTYTIEWTQDSAGGTSIDTATGTASGTTTTTVSDSYTVDASDQGHDIYCTVTVTDTQSGSASASNSVTPTNTVPTIATGPSITPATPQTADELTCEAESFDVDNDGVTMTFTWEKGAIVAGSGTSTATSASLTLAAANTSKGEVVTCKVVPTDDEGDSGTAGSTSVTIQNTIADIDALTLASASGPYVDSVLTCSYGTYTEDDTADTAKASVLWEIDDGSTTSTLGTAVISGTTTLATFDLSTASTTPVKGDTVFCSMTPNDTEADGTAVDGTTVTTSDVLVNKPPDAPTVTILTVSGQYRESKDDLQCSVTVGSVDQDGDTVTYSFGWTYTPLSSTVATAYTNATDLPIASTVTATDLPTEAGQTWECTVTPNDGSADGTVATSSVVIDVDCDVDDDGYEACKDDCTASCGDPALEDCNDNDEDINPGEADIVADMIDQDCDTFDLCYADSDFDGFGNPSITANATTVADGATDFCEADVGVSHTNDDCDDTRDYVNPDADEICDGLDDDCDGVYEDDEIDLDGDGFVTCGTDATDCADYEAVDIMNGGWTGVWQSTDVDSSTGATIYVDANGNEIEGGCDCNDDPTASGTLQSPGNFEECEPTDPQIDSDCDGDANTNRGEAIETGDKVYYVDSDGDDFGTGAGEPFCALPEIGYATNANDCDDSDPLINPNAREICNGRDDNCNNEIDNDDYLALDPNGGCLTLYKDEDQDDYGDYDESLCLCVTSDDADTGLDTGEAAEDDGILRETLLDTDYISRGGDCYDLDSSIFPGSGDDEDLSYFTTLKYAEYQTALTDGYINEYTLEEFSADEVPLRTEFMDGHDNNCDGRIPLVELDCDDDGSLPMLPIQNVAITDVTRHSDLGLAPCWDEQDFLYPEDNQEGFTDLPEITCWDGIEVRLECDPYTRLWVVNYSAAVDRYDGGYREYPAGRPEGVPAGDCDDQCGSRYPTATETCDGIDNDCSNAEDYYSDVYDSLATSELAIAGMDTDGIPDAMDSSLERIGTVTTREFDMDSDGFIGCGDYIGSTAEQDVPSAASCESIVDVESNEDLASDCNNFCALTNPVAEESCNGFADVCSGDDEGSDSDIDDAIACGIGAVGSGASLTEEIFVLAYIGNIADDPSQGTPGTDVLNGVPQHGTTPEDSGWWDASRGSDLRLVECDEGELQDMGVLNSDSTLSVADVSEVVPMVLPRTVAPAEVERWQAGPDDIVETDLMLKAHLYTLVGPEKVDQAVREFSDRLDGDLITRDPLLDFCACVNGHPSDTQDCATYADNGQCVVLRVLLDDGADEEIDEILAENSPDEVTCLDDYPEQVVGRTVWNRDRILDARQRVVEWECLRLYNQTCTEIANGADIDQVNVGGQAEDCDDGVDNDGDELVDCGDPECIASCVNDGEISTVVGNDWWMELGRYTVSAVTDGNLMGCWGDPTQGVDRIDYLTGGDCDNADATANRFEAEGPGDLLGVFYNLEMDCSTCLDGVDNNCDGQIDCADPGCAACFVGQGFGVGGGTDESCGKLGCSSTGLTRTQTFGGLAMAFLAIGLAGLGRRRRRLVA